MKHIHPATLVFVLFSVFTIGFAVLLIQVQFPEAPQGDFIDDFASEEQGTFGGQLRNNYPAENFDSIVVLLSSQKIPGLTLVYYPYEQKLTSGIPQMTAENIVLFDGQPHRVHYQFTKGGPQYLYYDHKVVASSNYQNLQTVLSGFMTGPPILFVSDLFSEYEFK